MGATVGRYRISENIQFSSISPGQLTTMDTHARPPQGLGRRLYEEMRARIADGTYGAGTALPSTRALAAERGLSRATVALVYEQLAADGFIHTRPGAASRVAMGAAAPKPAQRASQTAARRTHKGGVSALGARVAAMGLVDAVPSAPKDIHFAYGPLAGSDFPTQAWLRALRAVERQRSPRLEYEDPRGNLALRTALQAHLSQTRGLACAVEQIMIVHGSQQALDLCARMLLDPGDRVLIENPGYRMAHHTFEAYGAKLVCADVDAQGLNTDPLARMARVQLAYVTPTHQFPLGGFLPIARRRALLAWAARQGAWVLEDDYDSEYRYSVRPEATLQSLDSCSCVIHVGTFSKTLSPQLRLGYMVLPPSLVEPFAAAKRLADRHVATGVQRALALLLENGSYARHLRRMRRAQQARQQALVAALGQHLGDQVEVQGAASGLHMVVWFRALSADLEPALVQAARERGVRVHPIGPFYHPARKPVPRPAGLVMGYAALEPQAMAAGVRRLALAVRDVQGLPRPRRQNPASF